jgi:hypothetical protein
MEALDHSQPSQVMYQGLSILYCADPQNPLANSACLKSHPICNNFRAGKMASDGEIQRKGEPTSAWVSGAALTSLRNFPIAVAFTGVGLPASTTTAAASTACLGRLETEDGGAEAGPSSAARPAKIQTLSATILPSVCCQSPADMTSLGSRCLKHWQVLGWADVGVTPGHPLLQTVTPLKANVLSLIPLQPSYACPTSNEANSRVCGRWEVLSASQQCTPYRSALRISALA